MTNHLNKHQFISFLKFKAEANSDWLCSRKAGRNW